MPGGHDNDAPQSDGRSPDDHPAYKLTDRILGSWGRTGRALAILVVAALLLVLALRTLSIEVTLGPVHINHSKQ